MMALPSVVIGGTGDSRQGGGKGEEQQVMLGATGEVHGSSFVTLYHLSDNLNRRRQWAGAGG